MNLKEITFTALAGWLMLSGCNQEIAPESTKTPIERNEVSQYVYDALSMCTWKTIHDCMQKYPNDAHILVDALGIRNLDDWQAMNVIKLYPITEEIYRHYEGDNRLDDLKDIIQLFIDDSLLLDELIKISQSDSYCPGKYCFQNDWKYPIIKNPYSEAFNVVNRLEKANIPSRLWTRTSIKAWAMTLEMDSSL